MKLPFLKKIKKDLINFLLCHLGQQDEIDKILIMQGKLMALSMPLECRQIRDAEFRVFSQWGEDGIIQYIIKRIQVEGFDSFIEFGVEDYSESNTRFLLMNNNWRGLVIDGSSKNIESIQSQGYSWRHDLKSVAAFITKGNINNLIKDAGFSGEVGILSVDIDGNDFWIWDAINQVNPRIVIAEYNGLWGSVDAVSVPYDDCFVRTEKHHSNLYYGCSLQALIILGKKKGYSFIGSNSTGSNAFFVRKDLMGSLNEVDCNQEFIFRRFKEGRAINGSLTFAEQQAQLEVVAEMPLVNIQTGMVIKVSDLNIGR